jgi:2'-5' RNA ligase
MSNLVIVAIPEENDRVWKISSEQVPHLTLLFLGDADNNPHTESIVQFVEHAVTLSEHGPFYLDVDHRGTLGPDEADVLFFSNRSWNLRWIKQFRGQLLQNEQVRSAYDSVPQHTAPQDWVPHLTLGYPDTPAKADPNDEPFGHPIYSAAFDRIAVWTGDYDGPEFRLEWPDRELEGDLAVAWADEQKKAMRHNGLKTLVKPKAEAKAKETEAPEVKVEGDQTATHGEAFVSGLVHGQIEDGEAFVLEHYGVKGMRWGMRRSAPSAVAPKATSKVPAGNRRKTKVKVEGGQNHPAHEDAIKVEQAKAKLKKSGPKALSNQELRDVANRVQLENQVSVLTSHKGRQFVSRQLQSEGQNLARAGVRTGVKKGAKKVGAAGVAAIV